MIISVSGLREYITTTLSDEVLGAKLQALELKIRKYTNNRFIQFPPKRVMADVYDGVITSDTSVPFAVGDTVHIAFGDRAIDCGIYTVKEITGDTTFTVNEDIADMVSVDVLKVQYKMDVVLGAVEMIRWDLEKRDKVGIKSETISRHSVTYSDTSEFHPKLDYPKTLCGFLDEYKKPNF